MSREEFKEQFGAYVRSKGITKFTALECCDVGRAHPEGPVLQAPPRTLWSNIIPTLRAAEAIRDKMREKYPTAIVRVTPHGGYRDPKFNAACDGKSGSVHQRFNALDIEVLRKVGDKYIEVPASEVHECARSLPNADKMGIGKYDGFTHIDTRGYIGMKAPARW